MVRHGYAVPVASADEILCRAHPLDDPRPCPGCGFEQVRRPDWAVTDALFALAGKSYRVVAVGSTNRRSPRNLHFEDYVICRVAGDPAWELPPEGCRVTDLKQALRGLNEMPRVYARDLASAIRSVP
jgi:hypothetical protein